MALKAWNWLKLKAKTPAGLFTSVVFIAVGMNAIFQFVTFTCKNISAAQAGICITRSSVEDAADSIARHRDDSAILNVTEVLCDHGIDLMKHEASLNYIMTEAQKAAIAPAFKAESLRTVRMQIAFGLRRKQP
jgi:hypothetical protein